MKFKFLGKSEFSRLYAAAIWEYGAAYLLRWKPEVIVPVPIHKSRLKTRGYNQAEVLALDLGKIINTKVDTKLIKRIKKTSPQKHLGFEERFNNIRGAFAVNKRRKIPKRILVVDDIYTTGSTLDSVASLLKEHGVEEVFCVCVAIGLDKT